MANGGPFRLINAWLAHDGPVRCVAIGPDGELATGCQSDAPNLRRWKEVGDAWEEVGQCVHHDHWVTAITHLGADISREFYSDVRRPASIPQCGLPSTESIAFLRVHRDA